MSERNSKWKNISKASQKSTQAIHNTKELPERFRPGRERSESVDRIFNTSRSKVHSNSSLDHSLRKDSEHFLPEVSQAKWQGHREEVLGDLKREVLRMNTAELGKQTSRGEKEVKNWSKIVGDIKRQFTHFKKNVLQELQRQKCLVDQLIKEVILTLEYELAKLSKFQENPAPPPLPSDQPQVRTIQNWKEKLQTVNFGGLPKSSSVTAAGSEKTWKASVRSSEVVKESVAPPARLLDSSLFWSSLAKLGRQLTEMDNIFSKVPPKHCGPIK